MDQRDIVLGADARQHCRTRRIGGPTSNATLRRFRRIHGGVGAAIDNGSILAPINGGIGDRIADIEIVAVGKIEIRCQVPSPNQRTNGAAQLTIRAGHKRAARRHRPHISQQRMRLVSVAYRRALQWNGPLDVQLRVGEVHERVSFLELGRPMGVHQIGVDSAIFKRLKSVSHATRHVNGHRGIEYAGKTPAKRRAAGAQVHTSTKCATSGDGHEFVPRLGMDAARNAGFSVEAHIVLDKTQIGNAKLAHLGTLPVLLEPTARVVMHRKIQKLQAWNARLVHRQRLLVFDVRH